MNDSTLHLLFQPILESLKQMPFSTKGDYERFIDFATPKIIEILEKKKRR